MAESEAEIKGGGKFIQRTRSVGGGGERKGKTDASNTYYIKNLYVKVLLLRDIIIAYTEYSAVRRRVLPKALNHVKSASLHQPSLVPLLFSKS